MRSSITCFIGWRYAWSRHRHGFLSFVSFASIIGLALGVAILLTVCAVMNGFNHEVQLELAKLNDHLTLVTTQKAIQEDLIAIIKKDPDVATVVPYLEQPILLSAHGRILPIMLRGVPDLIEPVLSGEGIDANTSRYRLILSEENMLYLGLHLHERVTVVLPHLDQPGILGAMPHFRKMIVQGVTIAHRHQVGEPTVYTSLETVARLQNSEGEGIRYQITLKNPLQAPAVHQRLRLKLRADDLSDWTERFSSFFHALALEKTLLFVLLSFIVVIAGFTLVSSLTMMVLQKRADIAILRTMGLSTRQAVTIFIAQGMLMSVVGILLGLLLGAWMSHHITAWVRTLEQLLGQKLVDPTVFLLDHLPAILSATDIMVICGVALTISFLATLYPAYSAAKLKPISVLKGGLS